MVPMVCRRTAAEFTASLDGECTSSLNSSLWEDADEDKQTALVGKIEPTGSTLVVPVDVKEPNDQYGCEKLKSFI